jgi:hypothetical protein
MLKYEHKKKALLPVDEYYKRILNNFLIALVIIACSLTIGVIGYMSLDHLRFVDALLNASMILGGMGPVDVLSNDAAKYFATFYSLFSGITFLTTVALLLAPAVHRAMHRFHLQTEQEEEDDESSFRKKKRS